MNLEEKFPIGTRVRIKSKEEIGEATTWHIINRGNHYNQYGVIDKIDHNGFIDKRTIYVKRDTDPDENGICWYYLEWLDLADEDYAAIFKRKRDENLLAMFC